MSARGLEVREFQDSINTIHCLGMGLTPNRNL